MNQVKSRLTAISVLVAAGLFIASHAGASSSYFPNQPGNGGENLTEDVDFSAASIPVGQTGALSGLKYWVLDLATYDSNAACFTITTWGDQNTDTRIWIWDNTRNDYRSLNDDFDGKLTSQANIWIVPPSNGGRYVSPVISSYSSGYNSMQFEVQLQKRIEGTTEANCSNGATYKSTNSGNFFVGDS